jgi:hypothetical protein
MARHLGAVRKRIVMTVPNATDADDLFRARLMLGASLQRTKLQANSHKLFKFSAIH